MKIRIKFKKFGTMKYIGHLDFMRFFMKAVRRAGLPIKYTEGFNPHPVMSFALPLGVGVTSGGEYVDMELLTPFDCDELIDLLNRQMPEGVWTESATSLPEQSKKAMAEVSAADYLVYYKRNHPALSLAELNEKANALFNQSSVLVQKEGKKGVREVDLKPFVYDLSIRSMADLTDHWIRENVLYDDFCIDADHLYYRMTVSSGSNDNIKPELVIKAIYTYMGLDLHAEDLHTHRIELYRGTYPKLISLGVTDENISDP
ncbi:MAG: TIGR03936 family radical SAM-associated protein [Lachnospiraceae bacterium]|nr:TIGR03936 family radical SAM-associated protein [Lachnospiraceae bacterium]